MSQFIKIFILLVFLFFVIYNAGRNKKSILYFACAFLGLLPDTFAIEVSSKLPLLTVERMIIIVLFVYWLYKKRGNFTPGLPAIIVSYFFVTILILVINFRYGVSAEINGLFVVVFENFLVFVLVYELVQTMSEVDKCLDFMIIGCVLECMIGMFQTIFNFDIVTVLNIVSARADNMLTERMGLVRAAGTLNAIMLGSYCAIMCFIILYRYEKTRKKYYLACLAINICTMFFTMSRSSLVALAIVVVLFIIMRFKHVLRLYSKYLVVAVIGVIIVSIALPQIRNAIFETLKSLLYTLGVDVSMSSDFGLNASGLRSRLVQYSSINYMFDNGGFWLGKGYKCFARGDIYYFWPQFNKWVEAAMLDVGIVGVFSQRGLIGCLSWLIMIVSMLFIAVRRRNRTNAYYSMFAYLFILYLLLNILTAYTSNCLIWALWALFFAQHRIHTIDTVKKKCSESK